MEFVFGKARLEWRRGQGYRHPQNGIWIAEPKGALKGWMVQDPLERRQWVELVQAIEQFWRHNQPSQVDLDSVVDFG